MTSQNSADDGFRFSLSALLKLVTVVSLTIAVCVGVVRQTFSPVVPLAVEKKLRKGMTKPEVFALLGEPNRESDNHWQYTKIANPGWCSIYWDESGTLEYVDNEWP